jgi:hypothetical protein
MSTLQNFYSYVMPAVQGCPTAIVDNAIRHAVNEFCEKTMMWRYTFSPVNVVANQASYTLTPPAGSTIVAPVHVAVNNDALVVINIEDLDSMYPNWRTTTASSPLMYFMDLADALYLVPTPVNAYTGGLKVDAAMKMAATSNTCPDWLFNNWAEVIAHGALMRLHAMPGKVWADTNTVAYHKAKFREGISRAKSRTMKSFTKQGKSVQPRQFWQ